MHCGWDFYENVRPEWTGWDQNEEEKSVLWVGVVRGTNSGPKRRREICIVGGAFFEYELWTKKTKICIACGTFYEVGCYAQRRAHVASASRDGEWGSGGRLLLFGFLEHPEAYKMT
jgi:hypothetical protein